MQREWRKARAALAAVAVGTLFVTAAFAYVGTNGLFELDGNVEDLAGTAGDDWSTIYTGTSSTAIATAFVPDTYASAEVSFFTGGGSKDTRDVSEWLYDTANDVVPDKDDLSNVFAAAYDRADCYVPASGGPCVNETHTFFYFGADRFDAGDGSAQVGFWFFKQPVSLNPLAPGDTSGTFNGVHTIGDVLVILDFIKGGDVGSINVYRWIGGNKPLELIFTNPTPADIDCGTAGGPVCEVINTVAGEQPPWPYIYHNANPPTQTTYAPLSFMEAGIDLTHLFGEDIGCFASFMAETRSSASEDAQLKDFALGNFGVCSIAAEKTGPALSKVGDTADYSVTVTNTGRATLFLYSAVDTLAGNLVTNGVKSAGVGGTCGASLAPDASCTLTYSYLVPAGAPDQLRNVVTVTYREHSDFQTAVDYAFTDDFTTNLFIPSVTVDKTGDTLFMNGQEITYTFTITNTSSADAPALVLDSVSDSLIGPIAPPAACSTLASGASCSFTASRTAVAGDPDALTNTVTVTYHPTGFPNVVTAQDSHTANRFTPSLSIVKTGPPLAKVGDAISYHYVITNTSSALTPPLVLFSLVDDVLGDLTGFAPAACDLLAVGASCELDAPWTVAGAGDPLTNTVTAVYHPTDFASATATATDSFDLNVFQPSITFSKSVDKTASKVGDTVHYTIALTNTSSADTPDLVCTITDEKLGVNKQVTLAPTGADQTDIDYTVLANDPDPLLNTASATCSPEGWPNVLEAEDGARVDLFQPSVTIDKSVDATISKLGDEVLYTYVITNTSSADTPTLTLTGVSDDVVGDLLATAQAASCATLAPSASCTFSKAWTVSGAADPVVNTVTVHYSPDGFPNDITAQDSVSLPLFAPSMNLTKIADRSLSKVGDVVAYTITVQNTSTALPGVAIPAMSCTIVDTMLGVNKTVPIAAGASNTTTVNHTVVAGDPDPLVNTASATCSPVGFANVLTDTETWSVDLFQASVTLEKTGDDWSKPGDTASFTVTVTNTSGPATPDLDCTVTDSAIGLSETVTLATGASASFPKSFVIPVGTTSPTFENTADVDCLVAGFPNHVRASDSWTTNLLYPDATVTKTCTTPLVPIGGTAEFSVVVSNTGNAALISAPDETTSPAVSGAIAAGDSKTGSFTVDVGTLPPIPAAVYNDVTVDFTLAPRYGLPNTLTRSDDASCVVMALARVIKTVEGLPPIAPAAFLFELRQGASTVNNGTVLESLTANMANGGNLAFTTNLVPGQVYQLCEHIEPAWMTTLGVFVPGSFMPPDGFTPNPNVDNSILCASFEAVAGNIHEFSIDNTPPPGGNALTIGYWKNHASCKKSGGNQEPMLDRVLAAVTPPGILLGSNYLLGDPGNPDDAPSCELAVSLLDKSSVNDGKKRASDPLFNMAAQLIAAELNHAAQAYTCPAVATAINSANALLAAHGFTGVYPYAPKLTKAEATLANDLARKLDDYNNNRPSACQ